MNTMQVTIAGDSFFAYADVPTAIYYLTGQFSDDATAFLAASTDDQGRALVAMTRTLDRQTWQGAPTDPLHQEGDWPRTGLTYPDGTPVDPLSVPAQIVDACCEGGAMILNGNQLQNQQTTENLTRDLKAGSVSITYFRQLIGTSPRFPQIITELIRFWFGSVGVLGSESTGTGRKAESDRQWDYTRGY